MRILLFDIIAGYFLVSGFVIFFSVHTWMQGNRVAGEQRDLKKINARLRSLSGLSVLLCLPQVLWLFFGGAGGAACFFPLQFFV